MINYELYKTFGSFITKNGVEFRVYAPNANFVSVVGDFNNYDCTKNPLTKDENGVWQGIVKEAKENQTYKYFIKNGNREFLKADPFARYAEVKPNSASRIFKSKYKFKYPTFKHTENKSIYECHLGSWKRDENGNYLSYKTLAKELISYVKKMGFNYIELIPITEHPYDGSWGYQTTGYFAPTSRYGNPDEFKYFVDMCHKNGIGVILDWVPSHFATDGHGLIAFDGEALYEHPDPRKGYHPEWKSNIFNYESEYVVNFLISSAYWWINEYKIDGIRVDAVSSILYLDYARKEGEWIPNEYGNNINIPAINFLKKLNKIIHSKTSALMIAEESTAFLGVTDKEEGLAFDYKWNMGWMHDTINYFKLDPLFRKDNHDKLTFMFWYAFDENYILPLSHDEVVHMKGSMINKMSGLYDWKFANLRALYSFMYAFPGKKLLFMGNEIAQFNEWHYESQLDWEVLEYDSHNGVNKMITELNKIYKQEKALQFDKQENFEWTNSADKDRSIISFERVYKDERLLIICNFSGAKYENYYASVSEKGKYRLIFNSDASKFNGSDKSRKRVYKTKKFEIANKEDIIEVDLTPLSVRFFKLEK
jgi:1,4-alpha-glucan branching enzyme